MPKSRVTFTAAGGKSPARVIVELKKGIQPTAADLQFAGERQRARIINRTEDRGVDVDGRPFAPYSTKGPYYYYPNRTAGRKSRRRSASRTARTVGGAHVTPGGGLRFASYAAAKRAFGRSRVDLRGLPGGGGHMLNAIQVVVRGASQIVLGIFGEKAAIAAGHHRGAGNLPRRRWFDASREDLKEIGRDVLDRVAARVGVKRERL